MMFVAGQPSPVAAHCSGLGMVKLGRPQIARVISTMMKPTPRVSITWYMGRSYSGRIIVDSINPPSRPPKSVATAMAMKKRQVEFMIRKMYGSELGDKKLDDELDAIAVAVCHIQMSRRRADDSA